MKKIKQFSIIFGFVFLLTSAFLFFNKSKNKIVQQDIENSEEETIIYENIPVEFNSLEEKIYKVAYEQGRKSLYGQMGIKLVNINEKEFSYTINVDASDEEKSKYDELKSRGYVDGYHRACDSFYCPRNH